MNGLRKKNDKPVLVECATCLHFRRDTDGPSRNVHTREYFMGECRLGRDPDNTYNEKYGTAKIFADKKRVCGDHKHRS